MTADYCMIVATMITKRPKGVILHKTSGLNKACISETF